MNYERYPWLRSLGTAESGAKHAMDEAAAAHINAARKKYISTGAVTFPNFIHPSTLARIVDEISAKEDVAFTTDDSHTPHQLPVDPNFDPPDSVRNLLLRTQVASVAYDELPGESALAALYRHPALLALVSAVTGHGCGEHTCNGGNVTGGSLYLSEDPLGACSVNVFRPNQAHSFHFDQAEFSTTIMLREAEVAGTGLFQYTPPLRSSDDDLALDEVASVIRTHYKEEQNFAEMGTNVSGSFSPPPTLHTLDFRPGTLSIFSGSRSLHRVTRVEGSVSRLTAVLTYASRPGFRNSPDVQRMFWGRSSS